MSYTVKLAEFEGPFDLLYHLIEKSKVDIYDIPIAKITEQYLDYIKDLTSFDLEISSEFLLMASTLIEIKSKMLLPDKKEEQITMEIEENDPRQELVKRLIEYKYYKNIAEEFKKREEIIKKVYFKEQEQLDKYLENDIEELVDLEPNLILDAFKKLLYKKLTYKEEKAIINNIERDEISIDSKIVQMKSLFQVKDNLTFEQLFNGVYRKKDIIVTFMALLELIKSKYLKINQSKIFGEIIISKL